MITVILKYLLIVIKRGLGDGRKDAGGLLTLSNGQTGGRVTDGEEDYGEERQRASERKGGRAAPIILHL